MFPTKLLSGRLFLTVVCGLVFAYCSVMQLIKPDEVSDIVYAVFMFYFLKEKPETNGGTK